MTCLLSVVHRMFHKVHYIFNTLERENISTIGLNFYRAMHFSAKCGLAIACRPSARP